MMLDSSLSVQHVEAVTSMAAGSLGQVQPVEVRCVEGGDDYPNE